jgi:hypothetical protein
MGNPRRPPPTPTLTDVRVVDLHEHLHRNLPLIIEDDGGVNVDDESPADAEEPTVITQRLIVGPRAPALVQTESSERLPHGVTATLEVLHGPQVGHSFTLASVATTVGRSSGLVALDDPAVSRTHALIVYQSREFRVRDAGSANGVYLNGARVTDYPVRDGDELLVGRTTLLFSRSGRR